VQLLGVDDGLLRVVHRAWSCVSSMCICGRTNELTQQQQATCRRRP
jgi:hypothetical protein